MTVGEQLGVCWRQTLATLSRQLSLSLSLSLCCSWQTNEPIMAHPPDVDSDLTLQGFVDAVLATPRRGMKLDFKARQAVPAALYYLNREFTEHCWSLLRQKHFDKC